MSPQGGVSLLEGSGAGQTEGGCSPAEGAGVCVCIIGLYISTEAVRVISAHN